MQYIISKIKAHLLFIGLLLTSAFILIYFSYYNEFCEGGPDNIWHYYFSKYALTYPDFFLHHWGKPLFILLSTWFAHFGFFGIKFFNVLCGLLATCVAYKILEHYNIKFKWIIVPLLLFSPLYFIALQSALTEPLFSLILITTSYLYIKNKNALATILISFILFSRSEGTFLLLCFGVYLIIIKHWKYLPLLLTGFFIYAIVGMLSGHSFFWFFTENPYNYESPYGHGHFMDILKRYNNIWGIPFLLGLFFASALLVFLFFKQKQFFFWKSINDTGQIMYLLFIPAYLFLLFHLYVWHFGLCGSAGLERVLASVLPCFAVLTIWAFNKIIFTRFSKWIVLGFISIFLFFHLQTPFKVYKYPLKAIGSEKVELDAANWFKTIMPQTCKIYYAHPNIIFNLNRDPFNKDLNKEEFSFNKMCDDEPIPTFFFWDSQFSEFSCHVSTQDVEQCHYKKINEFNDGEGFRLIIFEKQK